MKSTLTILATLASLAMLAQQPIEVRTGSLETEDGMKPAYIVSLHETDENYVGKELKSILKDRAEKVSSKKLWFIDNARIGEIAMDTLDIHATLDQMKGTDIVDIYVAFNLNDTFITDDHAKHEATHKFVYDFALRTYKKVVEAQVADAGKALEKAEKEHLDLIQEKEKLEKSIDKNTDRIANAESDERKNSRELEQIRGNIEVKREVMATSSNEEDAKELQKLLSKRDKLESKEEKLKKTMRDSEGDIEKANRDLERNARDTKEKEAEVAEKKSILEQMREKLANVK